MALSIVSLVIAILAIGLSICTFVLRKEGPQGPKGDDGAPGKDGKDGATVIKEVGDISRDDIMNVITENGKIDFGDAVVGAKRFYGFEGLYQDNLNKYPSGKKIK